MLTAHRELWPHFRLHSQVLGYCPPLLVLLGDDGELEPLVVLEEGEHAGGDLGVRGLHPSKGGVSANTRRGQTQCELMLCLAIVLTTDSCWHTTDDRGASSRAACRFHFFPCFAIGLSLIHIS